MELLHKKTLFRTTITTPLEAMIAIADDKVLYVLEFLGRKNLQKEIEHLQQKTQSSIVEGTTAPIKSIEKELQDYFAGKLKIFKTPLQLFGTPFQKTVWNMLQKIPFGQTWSYEQLAMELGKPSAFRAVAHANSKNQLALIIPCHRVINKNGRLGGYGGGISNKQWLLEHEKLQNN
jgi:AraC family transcriptional regulator of adaptative response/methylated-DNA-[protein]-cysteine methyltransferase